MNSKKLKEIAKKIAIEYFLNIFDNMFRILFVVLTLLIPIVGLVFYDIFLILYKRNIFSRKILGKFFKIWNLGKNRFVLYESAYFLNAVLSSILLFVYLTIFYFCFPDIFNSRLNIDISIILTGFISIILSFTIGIWYTIKYDVR